MRKPRRLPRAGIRVSTTAVAVAIVGVSLVVTMAALVLRAQTSLRGQIATNAEARVADIALLVKSGTVPKPIPGKGEDMLVQIVDPTGTVLASSASIEGLGRLVDLRLKPGLSRTYDVKSLLESGALGSEGEGGAEANTPFMVSGQGVASPRGNVTVIVVASLDPVQQMIDALTPGLLAGIPLMMLITGVTVWLLTGRALNPVEAIRAEAEDISATSLDRRVPELATGDEISRLAATMNRMLDRLELAVTAQRRFVSDAAHELKSPVASMRTMLEVAHPESPEEVEALLADLKAEDLRLEQLVRDLLVLARADEGGESRRLGDIDLDDIVFAEAGVLGRSAPVSVDTSGVSPVRLHAEPGALESLVRNLIDNAVHHARAGVWVTLRIEGAEAVFAVSDDGPGISPGDRERVFERFVRLDESRSRDQGGTGLGLAVCRAVARSMGGDVRVAEPRHGGATFEVRLPVEELG